MATPRATPDRAGREESERATGATTSRAAHRSRRKGASGSAPEATGGRRGRRKRAAGAGPRRRRWLWRTVYGVVLVAALVVGTAVRASSERVAPPTIRAYGSVPAVVPGSPPNLPWPHEGQADLVSTSGIDFGTSGPATPAPIASLTKVMTAYVILHDYPLRPGQSGPSLTVTAADVAELPARQQEDQSLLIVQEGEQLTEEQALQALLLPSADNVADMLARFDAGTEAAFVAKMNATASALGMDHTHYADASGYDPGSVSTAADQLVLARAALKVPELSAIVDQPSATLPVVGQVENMNTLAGHDGYLGIKVGSTSAAGGCLVWAVTRTVDGKPVTLFGTVLGQSGGPYVAAAIRSAQALTDAAFAELTPHVVLAAGTPLFQIRQADQHSFAVTTTALTTVDPPGTPITLRVGAPRRRDLRPGTGPVATVSLSTPDTSATTSVVVGGPMPRPSLGWRLRHLF